MNGTNTVKNGLETGVTGEQRVDLCRPSRASCSPAESSLEKPYVRSVKRMAPLYACTEYRMSHRHTR
eukprot:63863-Rhodomonas_salina.5